MGYNAKRMAIKTSDGVIHTLQDAKNLCNSPIWPDKHWRSHIPILLPFPKQFLENGADNPLFTLQKSLYNADKKLKKAQYILDIKTPYPTCRFIIQGRLPNGQWVETTELDTWYTGFVTNTLLWVVEGTLTPDYPKILNYMLGI